MTRIGTVLDVLAQANSIRQERWPGNEKCDAEFRALEFVGEAGELCNAVKKCERVLRGISGNEAISVSDVEDEAADVIITLDLLRREVCAGPALVAPRAVPHGMLGVSPLRLSLFIARNATTLAGLALEHAARSKDARRKCDAADVDAPELQDNFMELSASIVAACDYMLGYASLDLCRAIVNKFNATSDKHGFAVRIDLSHGDIRGVPTYCYVTTED